MFSNTRILKVKGHSTNVFPNSIDLAYIHEVLLRPTRATKTFKLFCRFTDWKSTSVECHLVKFSGSSPTCKVGFVNLPRFRLNSLPLLKGSVMRMCNFLTKVVSTIRFSWINNYFVISFIIQCIFLVINNYVYSLIIKPFNTLFVIINIKLLIRRRCRFLKRSQDSIRVDRVCRNKHHEIMENEIILAKWFKTILDKLASFLFSIFHLKVTESMHFQSEKAVGEYH